MSRDTAYRIFKFFFAISVFGTFGSLLSVIVLPHSVRCAIGAWLQSIRPVGVTTPATYGDFPARPSSYDVYAFVCMAVCLVSTFVEALICRLFFDDLRIAENRKKFSNPNTLHLGMSIVAGAVAVVFTAQVLQSWSFFAGIAAFVGVYLWGRRFTDRAKAVMKQDMPEEVLEDGSDEALPGGPPVWPRRKGGDI
jgi:hypothetical protein